MTGQIIAEECVGNCNCCVMVDSCPFESEPLSIAEYDCARELDKQIIKDSQPKPMNMMRYIHNRPDKEAYTRERDRELDHAKYWRNPEKYRQQSLARYYKNKGKVLSRVKEYYQNNKEECKVKSKARYESNKEEINTKRKEKRQVMKETWSKVEKKKYTMSDGITRELLVIFQEELNFSSTNVGYRISKVVDIDSTPVMMTKTRITFNYKYVFEEVNLVDDSVVECKFISVETVKKRYHWFLDRVGEQ